MQARAAVPEATGSCAADTSGISAEPCKAAAPASPMAGQAAAGIPSTPSASSSPGDGTSSARGRSKGGNGERDVYQQLFDWAWNVSGYVSTRTHYEHCAVGYLRDCACM